MLREHPTVLDGCNKNSNRFVSGAHTGGAPIMTWPSMPQPEWPDERFEDLYHCHGCGQWRPRWWFEHGYTLFRVRMDPGWSRDNDAGGLLETDALDRCLAEGAARWQCDQCFLSKVLQYTHCEDGRR